MEELKKINDPEVRSQIEFLKEQLQKKSQLDYEINQCKIEKNYRQANHEYRNFKVLSLTCRSLNKKITDLKSMNAALNSKEFCTLPSEQTNKLLDSIASSESIAAGIDRNLLEMENSLNLVGLLKEKLQSLQDAYEEKALQKKNVLTMLYKELDKQTLLESLEKEMNQYKEKIQAITAKNAELSTKKEKKQNSNLKSIERMKLYRRLSDNAQQLRGKLLFRAELKKQMHSAEINFEHQRKLSQKEECKLIEDERFLQQLKKTIEELELEIDELYRTREDIGHAAEDDFQKKNEDNKGNEAEESATLSLNSLFYGFKQLKQEKELLVQENTKLKQRISILFTSNFNRSN